MTTLTPTTDPPPSAPRHRMLAWLRAALVVGSLGFLAYLTRNIGAAFESAPRLALLPVLAAAAILFGGVTWTAILWIRLVNHLAPGGSRPSTRQLFRSFSRSWIARYIPGTAWTYGARFLYTDRTEVPPRIVAATLVNEAVLIITSTAALGVGFWMWSLAGRVVGVASLTVALSSAVLVVAKTHQLARIVLGRVTMVLFARWKASGERLLRVAETPGLGVGEAAAFSLGYMLTGLGGGVAFALLAGSLGVVHVADMPAIIGGFNLAVFVGVVTFVAPAGVGVREAALAALLAPVITGPVAVVAAVALRALTLLVDAIFFVGVEAVTAGGTLGSDHHSTLNLSDLSDDKF